MKKVEVMFIFIFCFKNFGNKFRNKIKKVEWI